MNSFFHRVQTIEVKVKFGAPSAVLHRLPLPENRCSSILITPPPIHVMGKVSHWDGLPRAQGYYPRTEETHLGGFSPFLTPNDT